MMNSPMGPGMQAGGDFWRRIMMQQAAQRAPGGQLQPGQAQPMQARPTSLPGLPAAGSTGGPIARQGMPGLARTSMGIAPQRAQGTSPTTLQRDAETYQGRGGTGQAPSPAASGERLAMLQNRISAIRGAGGMVR